MLKEILICIFILSSSTNAYAASALPNADRHLQKLAQNMAEQEKIALVEQQNAKGVVATNSQKVWVSGYKLGFPQKGITLAPPEEILRKYENREIDLRGLQKVTGELTQYYRQQGYPVATAYLPKQEIENGIVRIQVLPGILDEVKIDNQTTLPEEFIEGFVKPLKSGIVLQNKLLEGTLTALNGVPGIAVKGVLEPGKSVGSSSLTILVTPLAKMTTVLYSDNHGGTYAGRYRYGLQMTYNEPFQLGDKLTLGGMISNQDMKNYNFGYELAVNKQGGRVGVSFGESDYALGDYFAQAGAVGKARTWSIYGSQPLYETSSDTLRLLYGYAHNDLTDELRTFDYRARKSSDVFNLGISGSIMRKGSYTGYSAVARAGQMKMGSEEARAADVFSDTAGGFQKFNADINHVTKLNRKMQLHVFLHGQLASRNLDSSEQIFLGGAEAVRAYPQGEASGDAGYQATAELRYQTALKGLQLAMFADVGEVLARKDGASSDPHRRLAGWGVGAIYTPVKDFYARVDYARKIKGEPYRSEEKDTDGRIWFKLYKLF